MRMENALGENYSGMTSRLQRAGRIAGSRAFGQNPHLPVLGMNPLVRFVSLFGGENKGFLGVFCVFWVAMFGKNVGPIWFYGFERMLLRIAPEPMVTPPMNTARIPVVFVLNCCPKVLTVSCPCLAM